MYITPVLSLSCYRFLMSEQKAESPVSPTRGWSPTWFWESIRRILPSRPFTDNLSSESCPYTLVRNHASSRSNLSNSSLQDQTRIDIIHHLAASQPVTYHENEEPMFVTYRAIVTFRSNSWRIRYLHPIDGLDDLSGHIKDKGAFANSIGGFSDVWKCFWVDKSMRVRLITPVGFTPTEYHLGRCESNQDSG